MLHKYLEEYLSLNIFDADFEKIPTPQEYSSKRGKISRVGKTWTRTYKLSDTPNAREFHKILEGD